MLRGALCAAGSDKRPVHRPALPYLHEFVVVDTPTAMSYVNPSNLADWGVTQGQVFDAARANLTAMASLPPGTASPDDPNLVRYWADRRCRNRSPLDNATLRLLQAQHGRCPLCWDYLLHTDHEPDSPREWEPTGPARCTS